jgi:hypothetical protein
MTHPSLERVTELLSYDAVTGLFTWRMDRGPVRSGDVAGSPNKHGYIQIQIDGVKHRSQRLAWLLTHGSWPSGVIDHIDGDVTNNRLENLRDVDRTTNQQNQRRAQSNNQTKVLGVCAHYGKYQARIRINGKQVRLGTFDTVEQASEAYLIAKRAHHEGCML